MVTARTRIYVGYDPAVQGSAAIRLSELLTLFEIDCTVYKGVGRFNGKNERAIVIEIIGDSGEDDFNISLLAKSLKESRDFPQDEVWIVRELVDLVIV